MAYYYFPDYKVDVFGYDPETETYEYTVETKYSSKLRRAKAQYKAPDKRNPYRFPYGTYINIIDPRGDKKRLFLDR